MPATSTVALALFVAALAPAPEETEPAPAPPAEARPEDAAQEPVAPGEERKPATPPRANGYLSLRPGWTYGWDSGDRDAPPLASLFGVPQWSLLTEGNVQLRVIPLEKLELYGDLSLFVNAQSQASGSLGEAPATRNLVVPSELYLAATPIENLVATVGKKRVVWGSGFAWNPADVLNPAKDPTDPSLQRAGVWMVRAEAPFEKFTLTALWSPQVTVSDAGLPRRMLWQPGSSGFDGAQQIFAARAYALVAQTDLNLMWFWSNRYADGLSHSHRFAASFSRYFFTDYELHVEALVQQGRDTAIFEPDCVRPAHGQEAVDQFLSCAIAGRTPMTRPYQDSDAVYARVIAGTRYLFPDESLLSLEYYYNGLGLAPDAFDDRQRFLGFVPDLADKIARLPPNVRARAPDPRSFLGSGGTGQPVRFAFDPARRHYLFATFQKPKIADDFTLLATVIAGLEDRSGLLVPGLLWQAREWLSFQLLGYIPVGASDSEYGSLPFRFRGVFEVRAYY